MPIQKFSFYDVVADIIPGVFAIGALFLPYYILSHYVGGVTPLPALPGGPSLLALLAILIYPIGRIVRGASNGIYEKYINPYQSIWGVIKFEDLIQGEEFDEQIYESFYRTVMEAYDIDLEQTDDLSYLRELCETDLYETDTLFRKYEALSTFLRSMSVVFLAASLYYAFITIPIIYISNYALGILMIVLVGLSGAIFYLTNRRGYKYEEKKQKQMIYDIILLHN